MGPCLQGRMGRSRPTTTLIVNRRLEELARFAKALRAEDRAVFDALVGDLKAHLPALAYANPLEADALLLWAAELEQRKRLAEIERRLRALEDGL